MFKIFGVKKKEKKETPPASERFDIEKSAARLIDRTHDIKLKLEKIELELKSALETYRNSRTQQDKLKAKKKAVEALKRKKMYQAQLQNLEQTSYNVENVTMQAEIARDNMDIVRILKQTNDMQKQMMKEMNVETVDDMIDEMHEAKYIQEEFTEAMQRNYDVEVEESELDQGIYFHLFIRYLSYRIRAA
jgi:hypothetical protein